MSTSHVSINVYELIQKHRNLAGSLDRKNRTELDRMYDTCENLLNLIKKQGKEHNADLSPYIDRLDQIEMDLKRIKKEVELKYKSLLEMIFG